MSLLKRVERALGQKRKGVGSDPNARKAQDLKVQIEKMGLLQKRSYGIAPPDTIGKKAHTASVSVQRFK